MVFIKSVGGADVLHHYSEFIFATKVPYASTKISFNSSTKFRMELLILIASTSWSLFDASGHMLRLLSTLGQRLLYTCQTHVIIYQNLPMRLEGQLTGPIKRWSFVGQTSPWFELVPRSWSCLPSLTQIYRYNVHRICLILRHNNSVWTRWKLEFIIKGCTEGWKIYFSPLPSFTFNKTTRLCCNGLQTVRRRLLYLHATRCHRATREKRPVRIPPRRFRGWST